jgi:hypothetical protein
LSSPDIEILSQNQGWPHPFITSQKDDGAAAKGAGLEEDRTPIIVWFTSLIVQMSPLSIAVILVVSIEKQLGRLTYWGVRERL